MHHLATQNNFLSQQNIINEIMNTKISSYSKMSTNDLGHALETLHSNFKINSIDLKNKNINVKYSKIDINNLSIHYFETDREFKIFSKDTRNYFAYTHVCAGKILITSDSFSFSCDPDVQSAIINYNSPCYLSQDTYIKLIVFKFSLSYAENLLYTMIGNKFRHPLLFNEQVNLNNQDTVRYNGIIKRFLYLLENDSSIYSQQQLIDSYERLIFTATLTCLQHNHSCYLNSSQSIIPKVIKMSEKYIYDNFKNDIKISDLTIVTGLSLRSIQIAFKTHRGYTPQFYLTECRLMHAYNILTTSSPRTSILSIALECGFSSQSYFSYCFRKRFGKTPFEILTDR